MAKNKSWLHNIVLPSSDGGANSGPKTCASLTKALVNLLNVDERNVIAKKGSEGYGGCMWIFVCHDGNMHHFKLHTYHVAMNEDQLYDLARQINEILKPAATIKVFGV